jgi:hypothetical protein
MVKDEQGTDAGTRAVQARAAEIKIDLARWLAQFGEADSIPLSVALLETGVDRFLMATTDPAGACEFIDRAFNQALEKTRSLQ